jgi:hypothetical protein
MANEQQHISKICDTKDEQAEEEKGGTESHISRGAMTFEAATAALWRRSDSFFAILAILCQLVTGECSWCASS